MNFYILNARNSVTFEVRAFGVNSRQLRDARVMVDTFTPSYFEPAYYVFSVPALVQIEGVVELTPNIEPMPEEKDTPNIILTPVK
jgi:hypothetical protein